MSTKEQTTLEDRVRLTPEIQQGIIEKIRHMSNREFANETGVSVYVITNLVLGRRGSVSHSDYMKIFGEGPSSDSQRVVDGAFFRQLVRLWLHLTANGKQALYRELSSQYRIVERTVYRIISGDIKTINSDLEDFMKRKLLTIGIPESKLEAAIEQHERENPNIEEERYSYDQIKPILDYLKENLGVVPTRILGRDPAYFKKHRSATISGEKYRYAEILRERTKLALSSGYWEEVENIINEVYGREHGKRILYQRIKPFVEYLESKGVSIKKLLGRSKSYYAAGFKTVSKGVYVAIVDQYLIEEEKEHSMQVPEGTFPLTTFTEVRRLANAVFDGYDIGQMASRLAELTTGRSAKALELCLTEKSLSLRNTDVAFEALIRMSSEQLEVARKKAEYDSRSVHYAGELVYVPGVRQFGVVTNVEEKQNFNEAIVFVRTYPSQREIKLFSGVVMNRSFRWNF